MSFATSAVRPTNGVDARNAAGSSRSYSDLGRGDGRGDALQFERAEIAERERLPSGEQGGDEGAATHLAGAGRVAEPARDDDGGAEVVGLVDQRLADVEADADLEALAAGRGASRRALHADGAADGVGGGGEGDHEAVAEPLHLVPAGRRDGIAQELVVRLEDALRVLIARALQQLGGGDEVGEEDRGERGGALRLRHPAAIVAPG